MPQVISANGNGRAHADASTHWDTIVIGSGFGGAFAAHALVRGGQRVLMIERGDWVARGEHNRDLTVHWDDREGYSLETPYAVEGESSGPAGSFHCVGGPSVFYGGVAMRLREDDFHPHPDVSADLSWPIGYRDLEPHYERAERLLGVNGDGAGDPTAPPRGYPLPAPLGELSATSRVLWNASVRLGLKPFRLPLALNSDGAGGRPRCTMCGICDGFACAIGAKNDLATAVLPDLMARGLALRPNTVAVALASEGDRISHVECVDRLTGERLRMHADRFVLAAGTLATPHLLLASGLERRNPAADAVGRYLMRHCNGVVIGPSLPPAGEAQEFRKQFGLHDFYRGDPSADDVEGRLGAIQQIRATQIALLIAPLRKSIKEALSPILERLVGFIVIAEDQPQRDNRVYLDANQRDRFGMPLARIHHRHSSRDRAARRVLAGRASQILREAGAPFTVVKPIKTFSHGLGTVRMGEDPQRFPVTPEGRFRGVENLWITDGSVFPTSAAVNPSLSIAANALRIGGLLMADESDDRSRGHEQASARTLTEAYAGE
jgi:choline dehydrogenase-like flavoprotein